MALWRQLTRGVRVLTNRTAADREVADEVQDYLDRATDAASGARALTRRGAPRRPAGARQPGGRPRTGARIRLGEHRRRAARRSALRRAPAAPPRRASPRSRVLTLALGIGGTHGHLQRRQPDPVRAAALSAGRPDRDDPGSGTRRLAQRRHVRHAIASSPNGPRSFEAMAVFRPWQPTLTGADRPERFDGQRVSAGYFQRARRVADLGRDFQPADDRLQRPAASSFSATRSGAGGSAPIAAIVGRQITLDDNLYTVIGVMPAGFENVLAPSAELWAPLQYDPSLPPNGREWGHHLRMVGRLRPGVGVERGDARGRGASARRVLEQRRPAVVRPEYAVRRHAAAGRAHARRQARAARHPRRRGAGARDRLRERDEPAARPRRAAARRVRAARRARRRARAAGPPGAHRKPAARRARRRRRHGRRACSACARWSRSARRACRAPARSAWTARVFAFALGVTTLIGLVVGLIPALQAARSDPHGDLQHGSRRTAGGHQPHPQRAGRRRGRARARAAGELGAAAAQPASGCSPCRRASTRRNC